MKYVARMTFTDPSDGGLIEAGRTFVSHEADVFRRFPDRFEIARTSGFDGAITRQRVRRRPARSRTSSARPYWLLGEREPWRLR